MIKNNNIFKRNKEFFLPFIGTLCLILSLSIFVSFSNMEVQEVIVKSMTPVYDENSTVVITEDNGVIFNDKDQVVKYNVVIENTQNYDVKISDIKLSTPSEEFLKYEVEGIDKDDIIKANSIKELVVSFETVKMEGWGRNFSDELITNITFDKIKKNEEPVIPEEDTDNEETDDSKDDNTSEEPKEEIIPEDKTDTEDSSASGDRENNNDTGTGNTESDNKEEVPESNTDSNTTTENTDTNVTDKEPVNKDEETIIVPDTNDTEEDIDTESETIKTEHDIKPAPETKEETTTDNSNRSKTILIIVGVAAGVTGITIVILNKNKFAKYIIVVFLVGTTMKIGYADEIIDLSIPINVNFESQNVMMKMVNSDGYLLSEFLTLFPTIKNYYIQNEVNEITNYINKIDVSNEQNERVVLYVVTNEEDSNFVDVYLQSDGIIYANENANYYFAEMRYLDKLDNLEGFDTSNVTSMNSMFNATGYNSTELKLDLSSFDTSKVTNMSGMFRSTGKANSTFTLDISNFDTRNVLDMSSMFYYVGYSNPSFTLDLSNFDTSNVKDMSVMFSYVGYSNPSFALDLSSFDTRNVLDMRSMFSGTGYNSENLTLDLSSFDTSNVTDMSGMFNDTGYNSTNFMLDLSNFDTGNVTDMSYMFSDIAQKNPTFVLDVSNLDTSSVTNMSNMFSGVSSNNSKFTLNLSNFDTSKVTNMSNMFSQTGYSSTEYILDLSNFDTRNVTDMSHMFSNAAYHASSFTLNLSSFDTGNVTNMEGMFSSVGRNTNIMSTLDTSHFVFNDLVDVSSMFFCTGYDSTALNVLVRITNPNISNYQSMFYAAVKKNGSKITVDYTKETSDLVDKMIATRASGSNVVKGKLIVDVDNPSIGDEIAIGDEKFNVISQTDETITMLAQYNLGSDYRQYKFIKNSKFADSVSWEHKFENINLDIGVYGNIINVFVNEYVTYLNTIIEDASLSGNIITLNELKNLECVLDDDYYTESATCNGSKYIGWLNNGQNWWTRTTFAWESGRIWYFSDEGVLYDDIPDYASNGIRPTITISKEALKNYLKT